MTERLHENEARVEELTKNWTSKWRETQKIIEVKNITSLLNEVKIIQTNIFILASAHSQITFFLLHNAGQIKIEDWINYEAVVTFHWQERALGFRYEGAGIKMESELPHLVCIDDDVLSTGVTLYHLKASVMIHLNQF